MHDPLTIILNLRVGKFHFGTLWHRDPETDGTDDSCGWFMRERHVDQKILKEVENEFVFNFTHNYWFHESGLPKFSVPGLLLQMYSAALWKHYYPNHWAYDRFFRRHLHDILRFAENPVDSMKDSFQMKYGGEHNEARLRNYAQIVYTDVCRKIRPWYKKPAWHIHHWRVTIYWLAFVPKFIRVMYQKHERVASVDQNLRDTV